MYGCVRLTMTGYGIDSSTDPLQPRPDRPLMNGHPLA